MLQFPGEWLLARIRQQHLSRCYPKYGQRFDQVAAASGIRVLRMPIRALRANAVCERCLGSVRRACLDELLILGERQLARVLKEYVAYFNQARPHQGFGQARPEAPPAKTRHREGPVRAVPVLGDLHPTYERAV